MIRAPGELCRTPRLTPAGRVRTAPPRTGCRACTTGRTRPSATSGQTCCSVSADDARLLVRRAGPEQGPGDRSAPGQEVAEVKLAPAPLLHADDDQASAPGQRSDVVAERAAAEQVEHHVGTAVVGRPPDLVDEVLLSMIDDQVRPELGAAGGALRSAGRRGHVRAERPGDLDREAADAARTAVDEYPLPGAQPADVHEVVPDRARGLGKGRRIDQVDAVGNRENLRLADRDFLGVTAALEQRNHTVTGAPSRHAGADTLHNSRYLKTRPVGRTRRRGVVSGALEQVSTVHAGCSDGDHHVPLASNRGIQG